MFLNNTKSSLNEMSVWKPEICIFGPGGMKGLLMLGAIIYLQERCLLDEVQIFVCCSIGCPLGFYYLLGCQMNDPSIIEEAMSTNLFKELNTIRLDEVKQNAGLINHNEVRTQMTARCMEKLGCVPTLLEFYQLTHKTFVCVTVNLDTDETRYLSWQTEPNLSVIDAILMSTNIPFLFRKIRYEGHVYIDGAFGNPYPVDLYDNGQRRILGISITTKKPMTSDTTDTDNLRYVYKVLNASITQLKKRILTSCSTACKHLTLVSPTMDTTGLTFTPEIKLKLLQVGFKTCKKFVLQELYDIVDGSEQNEYLDIIESSEEVFYDN